MHLVSMLGFLHVCMYILQSKMTNVDRHCQAIIPVIFNTHPPSQPNVKSTPAQSSRRTYISPTGLCMFPLVHGCKGKGLYIAGLSVQIMYLDKKPDWILNSQ